MALLSCIERKSILPERVRAQASLLPYPKRVVHGVYPTATPPPGSLAVAMGWVMLPLQRFRAGSGDATTRGETGRELVRAVRIRVGGQ